MENGAHVRLLTVYTQYIRQTHNIQILIPIFVYGLLGFVVQHKVDEWFWRQNWPLISTVFKAYHFIWKRMRVSIRCF